MRQRAALASGLGLEAPRVVPVGVHTLSTCGCIPACSKKRCSPSVVSGRECWRVRLGQVVTGVSNREVCPLGEGAPQGLVGRREEEAGGLRDR